MKDNDDKKRRHQEALHVVRRILNYVDPEGLEPGRPGGAPKDEYEMEAAPIAAFLLHHSKELQKDPAPLAKEIDRVWNEYFDRSLPGALAIAEEIIREWSRA